MDNNYCSSSSSSFGDEEDSFVKTITKESILAAKRKDLCRVMESLSVREHHSRTLLIHYHWDIEKLFAVLECKGKACLLEEAGIPVLDSQDLCLPQSLSMVDGICSQDIPASMTTKMDCGHCFCNSCWTKHFIVQINEGQSRRIRCMAHECSTICDEAIARDLVHERRPDLADKFDRFLLESYIDDYFQKKYIDDNRMVKWCPSVPHCGNAISVKGDELCEVECSCGKQFCFNCLSEAHSPCSCAMWARWKENWDDIETTIGWITVNTKPCPHCHELVEKDGDGNLVTSTCGQVFCWQCGCLVGVKQSRHYCDRYDEEKYNSLQSSKQVSYPYTHYHNRYKAHTDALSQESIITGNKMEALRARNLCDILWVKDGLCKLFRLRRTLSNLYPFAFYMFGDESILLKDGITKEDLELKQSLFEFHQDYLEKSVERLCNLLEEPFHLYGEERIMELKQKVTNLSSISENLCKHLYEHIETELLASLQSDIHSIVPHSTKGIEKAMAGCNIMSS